MPSKKLSSFRHYKIHKRIPREDQETVQKEALHFNNINAKLQGSDLEFCSRFIVLVIYLWLSGKESTYNVEDMGQISESGRLLALKEEMATHSSIPAWKIPWTEEPGGLYGVSKPNTTEHARTHTSLLQTHLLCKIILTYSRISLSA